MAGSEGIEPPLGVLPQKYLAGPPRFERGIEVLETSVIPFHHGPNDRTCLELRDPAHLLLILSNQKDGAGRDSWSTINLRAYIARYAGKPL